MGLIKKIKNILFEEEEVEPIKIQPEDDKVVLKEERFTEPKEKKEVDNMETTSERKLFRIDNDFKFPDFDEEEFANNFSNKEPTNVLEFERKKVIEKRNDRGNYEKTEYIEKKKFTPSPIISPVYGILNQNYKAEDVVNKNGSASNISIEEVRKKAFETKKEPKEEEKEEEPKVTFLEETESLNIKTKNDNKENYKTIDDLLEEASDEVALEEKLETQKESNMDAIEEELEKLDIESKEKNKQEKTEDDNDLFELIDSMYEDREEEK